MWDEDPLNNERWDLSRDRRLLWRYSRSITITSLSGVGGSVTLKALRELLGSHYMFASGGDMMRPFADELGMAIEEFVAHIKKHPELGYDRKIDEKLKGFGQRNGVVIESRLAHGLVQPAFHVLLTCEEEVRALRRRDAKEYRHLSLEEVARLLQKRDQDDELRYDELYVGHNWNENDYDLVQSTNNESVTPFDRAHAIILEHDRWKLKMMQNGIRIVE